MRADELVRLGVRELELGLDTEVGRELSRLADVCFDAAIAFHDRELRARYGAPRFIDDDGTERDAKLVVIGMGKLGGEELNFSSDVDAIYVYSSDWARSGGLSLHQHLREAVHASDRGAVGGHRGRDGVPCRFAAAPRGQQRCDRELARAARALLRDVRDARGNGKRGSKARACAGDEALGAEVMATLRPFVFPRLVAPTVIEEVFDLNRRIKRELVCPLVPTVQTASIRRTAKAAFARSSSSCKRCS